MSENERQMPETGEAARDAFGQTQAQDEQRHLDFLTSLILMGVSVAVIVTCQEYYRQQLARRMVATFYESTGFMPMVFAGFLLVMAFIQLIGSLRGHSVKAHALHLTASFKATWESQTFFKAVGGLAIFFVYIYMLLTKMPFGAASFLVLYATLMYSHWEEYRNAKTWLKMGVIALCASAGIVILFQYLFAVPMP